MSQIPSLLNSPVPTAGAGTDEVQLAGMPLHARSTLPPADPDPLRNLIVNFLPPLMGEVQVCELFSQFGPIESVKIIYDKDSGESRGYGFVKYYYFFSATYAISCLNRFSIAGKLLKVAYANAALAQEALLQLKERGGGFNQSQRAALSDMYYQQALLAQQGEL